MPYHLPTQRSNSNNPRSAQHFAPIVSQQLCFCLQGPSPGPGSSLDAGCMIEVLAPHWLCWAPSIIHYPLLPLDPSGQPYNQLFPQACLTAEIELSKDPYRMEGGWGYHSGLPPLKLNFYLLAPTGRRSLRQDVVYVRTASFSNFDSAQGHSIVAELARTATDCNLFSLKMFSFPFIST